MPESVPLGWENLFLGGTPYYHGFAPGLQIHPNVVARAVDPTVYQPKLQPTTPTEKSGVPPLALASREVGIDPGVKDERQRILDTRNNVEAYYNVFDKYVPKSASKSEGQETAWPSAIRVMPSKWEMAGEYKPFVRKNPGEPVSDAINLYSAPSRVENTRDSILGYWPVGVGQDYRHDSILAHELGHFLQYRLNSRPANRGMNPFVGAFGLDSFAGDRARMGYKVDDDGNLLPMRFMSHPLVHNFWPFSVAGNAKGAESWAEQFGRGLDLLTGTQVSKPSEEQAQAFASYYTPLAQAILPVVSRETSLQTLPEQQLKTATDASESLLKGMPLPTGRNALVVRHLIQSLAEAALRGTSADVSPVFKFAPASTAAPQGRLFPLPAR